MNREADPGRPMEKSVRNFTCFSAGYKREVGFFSEKHLAIAWIKGTFALAF